MTTTDPHAEERARRAAPPRLDDAIVELVESAHRAESAKAFLQRAIRVMASALRAPYATLEARLLSHVVEASVADPPEQATFWEKTALTALTDAMASAAPRARLYRGRKASGSIAILSAPLRGGDGSCSGAVVLVVSCDSEDGALTTLNALGAMAALTATLTSSLGSRASRTPEVPSDAAANLRKASRFASATELAYTLTNKLRTREGCDLVALGRVHGKRVDILSISGLDEVESESPGVRDIRGAMEECLDLGEPILFLAKGSDAAGAPARGRLHARWSRISSDATVASIPLRSEDEIVAVLSIRVDPHATCTLATLEEYRGLVEPYASTIGMLERAERSLARHAIDRAFETRRALLGRGQWGRKLRVGLPVLFFVWLVFGKLEFEVTAPCSVAPSDARALSAPQDAVLSEVLAFPGDRVQAGDVLCSFDTEELVLEKAGLESELAILDIEENLALASGAPADLKLVQANMRELESQLALVEFRIAAAHVRAPMDGVLVEGDLRERLGDVFAKGEPLYEISSASGWSLELEIPEIYVAEVSAGLAGRFSSLARPENVHELVVRRVSPGAEARQGDNVFVAEAEAQIEKEWIRSGMEGLAKIDIGARPAWWVLFHRVGGWIRLKLWL